MPNPLALMAIWRGTAPTFRFGPVHLTTEADLLSSEVGTKCGLLVARGQVITDATLGWADPDGDRPRCGDCFGDASITDPRSI